MFFAGISRIHPNTVFLHKNCNRIFCWNYQSPNSIYSVIGIIAEGVERLYNWNIDPSLASNVKDIFGHRPCLLLLLGFEALSK